MSQSSYSNNIEVLEFEVYVMSGDWEKVIDLYKKNKFYHTLNVKKRGTALHVAVSNGNRNAVKDLVREILSMWNDDDETHPLRMKNEKHLTPLHIAAYRGFVSICECIIGKKGERKDLIKVKNPKGETPLFWAVIGHKSHTFVYLHQFVSEDIDICMAEDGTTILHVAIHGEMFSLAYIIMYCYANDILCSVKNKNGVTPLQELASKTSAFKSGNDHLSSWWKLILYFCHPVTIKHDDGNAKLKSCLKKVEEELLEDAKSDAAKSDELGIQIDEKVVKSEKKNRAPETDALEKQARVQLNSDKKLISKWPLSLLDLDGIKIIKKRHLYGERLLKGFMENENRCYESYWGGGDGFAAAINIEHEIEIEDIKGTLKKGRSSAINIEHEIEIEDTKGILKKEDLQNSTEEGGIAEIMQELISKQVTITSHKKELLLEAMKNIETKLVGEKVAEEKNTIYLIAAKHGIVEIMKELESKMKSVMHDINSNNENVLLLAVKYRQPQVVEQLQKRLESDKLDICIFESLCQHVDNKENTMLHLAAYKPLQKETTWRTISGPAMQMMWDIKWYQDYNAKLSDFGMAKDGPEGGKSHVSTRVMGTQGYSAPEYLATGHLTKKSGVYSFEVVLLEIMSGKRVLDKNRPTKEHNLVEWVKPLMSKRKIFQVMDARIEGQYSSREAMKVAHIEIQCMLVEQKYRPNIDEVVRSLEQLQDFNDKTNDQRGKSVDESLTGEGSSNISSSASPLRSS